MAMFGVKNILKSGLQFFVKLGLNFFLYHVDKPPIAFWFGILLYLELSPFFRVFSTLNPYILKVC